LRAHERGLFFVQDISQAKVAQKVPVGKADKIIDICAAPGGKTLAVLAGAEDAVFLVSADVSRRRLRDVANGLRRCGFPENRCVAVDGRAVDRAFRESFDVALVDAPCTNTWVLRRRVDARWRLRPSDVAELASLQLALASKAGRLLKKGGVLVYATCSVLRAENEDVVARLLDEKGWVLIARQQMLPGEDGGDGAFVAMLGKT